MIIIDISGSGSGTNDLINSIIKKNRFDKERFAASNGSSL